MSHTYPEHKKLRVIREQSQQLGQFLEWLDSKGMRICKLLAPDEGDGDYFPIFKSTEKLLADYFEIDLEKLEAEKREMLDELREINA